MSAFSEIVQDITIRRGSSGSCVSVPFAITMSDGSPAQIAGNVFVLSAYNDRGLFFERSTEFGELVADPVAATVVWLPDEYETRAIRPGRLDRYTVTLRTPDGSSCSVGSGYLIGKNS